MSLSLSLNIYIYTRTLCHYACPPQKITPKQKKMDRIARSYWNLPLPTIRISVNLLHLRCQRHSRWQVHEPTPRPASNVAVEAGPPLDGMVPKW